MQRFFAQQFYIDTKSLRFIKLRTIQKLKIREWQKKLVEIAGLCGMASEPRSGGVRKTRPFGGSAGSPIFGTLAGAGARGILSPPPKICGRKFRPQKRTDLLTIAL